METIEMTDTERLAKINSLKDKHESIKREILIHLNELEQKQGELLMIEEEYVKLMEKLIK